jgi:hypothetical protein
MIRTGPHHKRSPTERNGVPDTLALSIDNYGEESIVQWPKAGHVGCLSYGESVSLRRDSRSGQSVKKACNDRPLACAQQLAALQQK